MRRCSETSVILQVIYDESPSGKPLILFAVLNRQEYHVFSFFYGENAASAGIELSEEWSRYSDMFIWKVQGQSGALYSCNSLARDFVY